MVLFFRIPLLRSIYHLYLPRNLGFLPCFGHFFIENPPLLVSIFITSDYRPSQSSGKANSFIRQRALQCFCLMWLQWRRPESCRSHQETFAMVNTPQRRHPSQLPEGSQFFSYSLELAVPYDLLWFYQADFIRHRDEAICLSAVIPNFVLTWDVLWISLFFSYTNGKVGFFFVVVIEWWYINVKIAFRYGTSNFKTHFEGLGWCHSPVLLY